MAYIIRAATPTLGTQRCNHQAGSSSVSRAPVATHALSAPHGSIAHTTRHTAASVTWQRPSTVSAGQALSTGVALSNGAAGRRPRAVHVTAAAGSDSDAGTGGAGTGGPQSEALGAGRYSLPCLCFQAHEAFLPGSKKVLHLYEARFLAMLDQAMHRTAGLVGCLLVRYTSQGEGVDGCYMVATLGRIESVSREETGARVELVAEGRIKVEDVSQAEYEYITGTFSAVTCDDEAPYGREEDTEEEATAQLSKQSDEIRAMAADIKTLIQKVAGDESGSTLIASDPTSSRPYVSPVPAPAQEPSEEGAAGSDWNEWGHAEVSNLDWSLQWVDAPEVGMDQVMHPSSAEDAPWGKGKGWESQRGSHSVVKQAERLSFAMLQLSSLQASDADEVGVMLRSRLQAMQLSTSLTDRLDLALSHLEKQMQKLRAKAALKALEGGFE